MSVVSGAKAATTTNSAVGAKHKSAFTEQFSAERQSVRAWRSADL